jgi:hypothetical protein
MLILKVGTGENGGKTLVLEHQHNHKLVKPAQQCVEKELDSLCSILWIGDYRNIMA